MREQSQIEDMRAAIRGDLERSRARQQVSPALAPEPEPEPEPPVAEEPEPRRGFFSSLIRR